MIPFGVDPLSYLMFIIVLIAAIGFATTGYIGLGAKTLCYIFSLVFVVFVIIGGFFIYTGSVQQVDIVVCNHITDDSWMYIIGEDQQTYMISDPDLKLRIHDGDTISTMVLNKWGNGYKEIYKIDAPFVCEGAKGC